RYPVAQVAAVAMVSAGVVVATLASVGGGTAAAGGTWAGGSAVGVALLSLGVVLAALLGLYQEHTYRRYGKHWREGLFYNHALALPMFAVFWPDICAQARALSQSAPAPAWLGAVPSLWVALALNVVSQLACASGVHRMTSMSSSLTLNVVLNVRKLVSLVISVVLFRNPVTPAMVFGCALVFLGSFLGAAIAAAAAAAAAEQSAASDSDGPVERGRSQRRLSRRAGEDSETAVAGGRAAQRRRMRQSLGGGGGGDGAGYASSPTESRRLRRGHADSVHASVRLRATDAAEDHGSSGPETGPDPAGRGRRVVPQLLVAGAGSETEGTATPVVPSPPPTVDKPREERSYKEFFPDLNVHMPLVVQLVGGEALAGGGIATPVSSGSEVAAVAQLDFGPGGGKGAQSYAGTPQSAVVVLAPKRPVVALPEARFRRVARERRARYVRPDGHYIRNVELTEQDLAERVEYDLDQVDQRWLEALNAERAERGAAEVSAKQLEAVVDHMEKEWFDLVKDTQRAISAMQQERLAAEESTCAICGEDECDNTNAIVFCDGCNMAVHQDCYGVPYIPEGQWLCRRCMLSPAKDVACVLCPQRGGAFKKTTTNKWAHVLCALWIPEVGIANSVYMEPIDGVDQIPRSRWRLYCHLCHRRNGACIQCSHRQCVTAFHATCARRAGLSMAVRADRRSGEPVFRAFCERHTPSGHVAPIDVTAPLRHAEVRRRPSAADGAGVRPAPAVVASADAEARALLAQAAAGDEAASLRLTMRTLNPDVPVLNEYVVTRVAAR
ncbi:hypothetical protein IWQ56_003797, partial [Coemansia nantahalensis]